MAVPNQVAALGISEKDWRKTPASVRSVLLVLISQAAQAKELSKKVEALSAENAVLRKRVEELEERLNQNSSNSSKPPSTDSLDQERPKKEKERSGEKRKPGGQPGHPRHERTVLPVEEVDHVIALKPTHCSQCGHPLEGEDCDPERHQVTELPQVVPMVTEYQLHGLECPCCNHVTKATLPEGVPRGAFGPRLQAIVAVCSGLYHLSRRTVQGLMEDLFGVTMSLGSVINSEQVISDDLEAPVAEAHEYVMKQAVINADETGWREGNRRAWLWVAVSSMVTVFLIHARRGAVAARQLLGNFAGILGSDRWNAYNKWVVHKRQLCWAHLIRDFAAMALRKGKSARIGEGLLEQADLMFQWWHRVRDGTLKRSTFQQYMFFVRTRVEDLLAQGEVCGHDKTEGTCKEILKLRKALWTFVRVEGVEPTNNVAERAVRAAVLWRKNSFGCHSEKGSRFVERMLTVTATLKQQNRNLIDYIVELRTASLKKFPAPSLLPDIAQHAQIFDLAA